VETEAGSCRGTFNLGFYGREKKREDPMTITPNELRDYCHLAMIAGRQDDAIAFAKAADALEAALERQRVFIELLAEGYMRGMFLEDDELDARVSAAIHPEADA
jgi:hypothetical protein